MVKNNLFTMITVASLCTFACYGIDSNTYDFNDEIYEPSTDILTGMYKSKEEFLDAWNEFLQDQKKASKKNPMVKPRSFKTGYGLKFLPQDSQLKSLYKDPQNIKDLSAFAQYLQNVNRIGNIDKEDHSNFLLPIRSLKRAIAMAQRKKIISDIDKSVEDVNTSIDQLISKLPESQQSQALDDCYKAKSNALYNRFQNKRYF